MTLIELGAVGEFVGAIGVIATLAYLATQIRQNTRSMEDGKRLALAQTYQMRADALQSMMVDAANSEHVGSILVKLTGLGYPENVSALAALDEEERGRFRQWQIAQQTHWDNLFYQYQQGFLDTEYYQDAFRTRVRRLAPTWQALGLINGRRSFVREIEELLEEANDARREGAGG